jgi:hypothetical protein
VRRLDDLVDVPVDPAQQRGLGYAEGGVRAFDVEVEREPGQPEGLGEALPQ